MNIYDRISSLLRQQNKTRRMLCDETGISYHTLTSLFQRQSQNMKLDTIIRIAKYLDVSVEFLISGEEKKPLLLNDDNQILDPYRLEQMDKEIIRIAQKLSVKSKTLLLAKAYELEEKDK